MILEYERTKLSPNLENLGIEEIPPFVQTELSKLKVFMSNSEITSYYTIPFQYIIYIGIGLVALGVGYYAFKAFQSIPEQTSTEKITESISTTSQTMTDIVLKQNNIIENLTKHNRKSVKGNKGIIISQLKAENVSLRQALESVPKCSVTKSVEYTPTIVTQGIKKVNQSIDFGSGFLGDGTTLETVTKLFENIN
ncbi:hypothetical protein ACTFIY_012714 [Dictyostelium cf. discoideum]